MMCLAVLLATNFSGGSAQPHFLRRQLGRAVCTEEQCRSKFTTMNAAGDLTGYFYSYDDIPTKGCFIKNENMYFGTGGTIDEMSDADVDGEQERVWCDATSSIQGRSGNGDICLTEDQCEEKFAMMKENNVVDGYFYASSDFPTKGCIMKGANVYFGIGGTENEMAISDLPGEQLRVLCDGTSDRPSSIEGVESGDESKSFWSLYAIIGVAVGGAAAMIILIIGLKRYKRKG
ncbi:hypothetical protein ACHAW5_001824 [Stephanodiscus triporus]|uniref:Uncharacterized protein n=1 Tax=Stephanodiscus triporus TaxID=2934178 RepID=A0ABD3MRQ1_9STRA